MISFIKKLFGFGSVKAAPTAAPYKIEPTPTPVVTNATPNSNKTLEATYIEPAKPVIKSGTVAASETPAKRNRRPRNRNKVKAGGSVANLSESNTKGGNGAVKTHHTPAKVATVKSTKPKNAEKTK